MIYDYFAGSQFDYDAGAAGTVVVPPGKTVIAIQCYGTAGTLTITPKGANQNQTAGPAIPIVTTWRMGAGDGLLGQLGEGSILVFASTTSYAVIYASK